MAADVSMSAFAAPQPFPPHAASDYFSKQRHFILWDGQHSVRTTSFTPYHTFNLNICESMPMSYLTIISDRVGTNFTQDRMTKSSLDLNLVVFNITLNKTTTRFPCFRKVIVCLFLFKCFSRFVVKVCCQRMENTFLSMRTWRLYCTLLMPLFLCVFLNP